MNVALFIGMILLTRVSRGGCEWNLCASQHAAAPWLSQARTTSEVWALSAPSPPLEAARRKGAQGLRPSSASPLGSRARRRSILSSARTCSGSSRSDNRRNVVRSSRRNSRPRSILAGKSFPSLVHAISTCRNWGRSGCHIAARSKDRPCIGRNGKGTCRNTSPRPSRTPGTTEAQTRSMLDHR